MLAVLALGCSYGHRLPYLPKYVLDILCTLTLLVPSNTSNNTY